MDPRGSPVVPGRRRPDPRGEGSGIRGGRDDPRRSRSVPHGDATDPRGERTAPGEISSVPQGERTVPPGERTAPHGETKKFADLVRGRVARRRTARPDESPGREAYSFQAIPAAISRPPRSIWPKPSKSSLR